MKFAPTLPSPKISFFCRYLKDLKVLDVETSDVLFFFQIVKLKLDITTEVHDGFSSDFGMSNVGAQHRRWKIVKSRLQTCRFGSWGLEAFRKAIEKAMEKIMEADIFENMTWSLFFKNSAVQHGFSFNPVLILLKKKQDFLTVSEVFFVSNVFSVEIFISVDSTPDEAREALPKLERPPLRVVHMGAGGVLPDRGDALSPEKNKTAVKNKVSNLSTTEQLETKDIQICVLVFCGFHGWI